jgi:ferredoxin
MADRHKILICSCEDTMPLDAGALARGCRNFDIVTGRQLCRAELDRFRALAGSGAALAVGCTQEEPLFREMTEGSGADLRFVNLRESAGWSADAAKAGPKMAALAAAGAEPMPDVPFVQIESVGMLLVYGRDERAVEAAGLLKEHLDVTVLLTRPDQVMPPRTTDFPIVKGTIRTAKGRLGAFELVVDDYAMPLPSSRGALVFAEPRNGAISHCDIVLDLSGGSPLFPAPDLRDGHLRADPGDAAAVLRAVLRARDLVGSFNKPRYITFDPDLCAHSRSRIVGCHRCLDLCPTSAIAPAGDHVAIDEKICAGCGECAAACPTGAASHALPPSDALLRKLRTLLVVYRDAGGTSPVLLLHDNEHGGALIDALARHGDGLPAQVLPLAVNELTQIGLECIVAAFAYGAAAVRILLRAKPRHDPAGLYHTITIAEAILAGLGLDDARITTIKTDDPFVLGDAVWLLTPSAEVRRPARFEPTGGKRDLLRLGVRELHSAASATTEIIALPTGAPFGAVEVGDGCTLCLSCVSVCPTGALSDDPERPVLRFTEDACVQCGLCKATCPEKVITLVPRLVFGTGAATRVLREEEPFQCVRCGEPFGVKSTIDRIIAKLEGQHWIYQSAPHRLDLIRMCEDCRVITVAQESFDPHGAPSRPKVRTTDDYLRERDTKSEG